VNRLVVWRGFVCFTKVGGADRRDGLDLYREFVFVGHDLRSWRLAHTAVEVLLTQTFAEDEAHAGHDARAERVEEYGAKVCDAG